MWPIPTFSLCSLGWAPPCVKIRPISSWTVGQQGCPQSLISLKICHVLWYWTLIFPVWLRMILKIRCQIPDRVNFVKQLLNTTPTNIATFFICTCQNNYVSDPVADKWPQCQAIQLTIQTKKVYIPQAENFNWNSNFAMANSQSLNSDDYYIIFRNLSMIAYIIAIQNQNLIFNSVNLPYPSQVAKLNSVYIFIL